MKTTLLSAGAAVLLVALCACGAQAKPVPTSTPSPTAVAETYGQCVAKIKMGDDVQAYIDQVKKECGDPAAK